MLQKIRHVEVAQTLAENAHKVNTVFLTKMYNVCTFEKFLDKERFVLSLNVKDKNSCF